MTRTRLTARRAAYIVAAVVALSLAYDLMRMPIQRFDAVQDLVDVQKSPSVSAAFMENLGGTESTGGTTLLRPVKFAQMKALLEVSGGHYWLAFRGFHAALLIAAVLLFVCSVRVRDWVDFSAAAFALTVFTGLQTFPGTVREAFPINHFLEVVVCCLIAMNLARLPRGWPVDLAAAATFIVASLVLESGVLVWVIIIAAWATGMPGVSRRTVVLTTLLLGLYLGARFFFLSITFPGLAERSSGFLLDTLEGPELVRRFGDDPTMFYGYNVVAAVLSVLFAEPQSGLFVFVRSWLAGDVPPVAYVAVVSSALTTTVIIWAAVAHGLPRVRAGSEDHFILAAFAATLAANAAISFAYSKDEIMSPAGALYACAAFVAARAAIHAVRRLDGRVHLRQGLRWDKLRRATLCVLLACIASLWAVRSAGLHHVLRVHAFKQRNDWARLDPQSIASSDPRAAALTRQLRDDALALPVPVPDLLGAWADRWWGE